MKNGYPRICFFGCGKMARQHARGLRRLYPALPLYFASRDRRKAEKYAEGLGGSGCFGSYEEAAQSGDFDISFLTTPQAFHAELAVLSAERGKDLIIEKPVTRTLEELAAARAAVERHGVRCTVAENYYFKPIIRIIREFIEADLIGRVLFVELTKTGREKKSGWRTDEDLMGGGALLEGGVHWLNALSSIAGGVPEEVIAAKPKVDYATNIPFEDSLLLMARFSNGVVGRLLHSWSIPAAFLGLSLSRVYGTEGVITLESNGLFCCVKGKRRKMRVVDPREFLGFREMHRSFVGDWMEGRPWRPTLQRIEEDMRLVHSAYRSLRTHRFERI